MVNAAAYELITQGILAQRRGMDNPEALMQRVLEMAGLSAGRSGAFGLDIPGFYGHGALIVAFVPILLLAAYFFSFWDKRSDDSASAGDNQVLLKLTLWGLLLASVAMAASGLQLMLGFLFAGAPKGTSGIIKMGLSMIIAGGGMFALVYFLFLPRSNNKDYPRIEKLAFGYVAGISGIITLSLLLGLLNGLFNSMGWKTYTGWRFGGLAVYGALTFVAMMRFGSMSGWTVPVRAAPMAGYAQPMQPQQPMQGYPQQPQQPMQGYGQPQGGGYPPQGGGQQGGGGLPPPGGGYPPPGGGYPPR